MSALPAVRSRQGDCLPDKKQHILPLAFARNMNKLLQSPTSPQAEVNGKAAVLITLILPFQPEQGINIYSGAPNLELL